MTDKKYETMSAIARATYAKALASTDDAGRIPLMTPGAMADKIGVQYKPETMLWCMTEWLVMRLARLVVDGGDDYIELDPIEFDPFDGAS